MDLPNETVQHLAVTAGVTVWGCSSVWGFGHRCASHHGHLNRCKCQCGEEQPPLSQCPNMPGFFHGGQFVPYPQTVYVGPQA